MSDLRADAPAEVRFLFQESQKAIRGGARRVAWRSLAHVRAGRLGRPETRRQPTRHTGIRQAERSDRLARRAGPGRRRWRRRQPVARARQEGRAQGQGKDHRAGREAAGDGTAQGQTAGRSDSESDDSGADACVGRSRAGGRDGRHSDIRLARTRPWRRRGNRAGHRHRLGTGIWSWRRDGAAAPAAARIGRATASKRRVCFAK